MKGKHKFLKSFSNLIADERGQVIVVIDKKPYTWNRAYDEIEEETKLGKKILDKLIRMGIL